MIRIKKFRASILMSLFSVAFLSVRQTGGAEGKSRTVESQIPTSLERGPRHPLDAALFAYSTKLVEGKCSEVRGPLARRLSVLRIQGVGSSYTVMDRAVV